MKMNKKITIKIGERSFISDKFQMAVFSEENNNLKILKPSFEPHISDGCALDQDCLLWVNGDTLQGLLDELWFKGFRPSKQFNSDTGELHATKFHLEDMRKLVFNNKEVGE